MRVITIRLPDDVAEDARAESEAEGESINHLVVDALAESIRRRRARRALRNMADRRTRMQATGRVSPSSEPLIRDLRQGRDRRE